jgi:hypothetical protein
MRIINFELIRIPPCVFLRFAFLLAAK